MKKWLLIALAVMLGMPLSAQHEQVYPVGEIYQQLDKLRTLGSVLYVAAHPDDENTRFISWCANEKHVETAYISLTRGDGGQNLVGPEKGKLLGVIRTNELLEARKIDRGQQFFTRANDFGYSKTSDETLKIWDRDKVLADLVWVIRKFRPDVVVTRFPPPEYDYQTHGHHRASAVLAQEAFDLAADPNAYTEQLDLVETWQPKRLYWNTSTWFYRRTEQEFDPTGKVMIDVGTYNHMLGRSMGEIAGLSRSQHKSQGFGAEQTKGSIEEWFVYVKGDLIDGSTPEDGIRDKDLFDGIDLTWNRVRGAAKVKRNLADVYDSFDPKAPRKILPDLLHIYDWMKSNNEDEWVSRKMPQMEKLILMLGGIFAEVNASERTVTPGSKIFGNARIISREAVGWKLLRLETPDGQLIPIDTMLENNQYFEQELEVEVLAEQPFTHPYWLRKPMDGIGMYRADDLALRGLPVNPPALPVTFVVEINGQQFSLVRDIKYNYVDRVDGEVNEQLVIAPPITANFSSNQVIFSKTGQEQQVGLTLKAWKDSVKGVVQPRLSEGWTLQESSQEVFLESSGDEQQFFFNIRPPAGHAIGSLKVDVAVEGSSFNRSHTDIDYGHIPRQTLFPDAEARLVKMELKKENEHVGYIMGAGDEVPRYLELVGYDVTMINRDNFNEINWAELDAVMVGIRAFNTEEWLLPKWDRVLQYANEGGNLIVQYQTTWGLQKEDFGPYELQIGRDRITVEEAEMRPVNPEHPVLNTPNKLTSTDYDNWVQERGLYFAESWGDAYQPIFSANDPGEDPHEGALVIAQFGQGHFVYTGISFFRQLPAGVPGSYRLLANIIALEQR